MTPSPPEPKKKKKVPKHTVGWTEYVGLPELGIDRLDAKVDTGARTSALHVENVVKRKDGLLEFDVVLSRKKLNRRVRVSAPILKRAKVRSSTGEYHERYFIKTRLRLGPVEKDIELSLVSREKMVFRMLIGRKALERDFLVDVSKRRVHAPQPKEPRLS
ncbi:MAG: RimK/LysX family protein [Sumerlaeia bacterium]